MSDEESPPFDPASFGGTIRLFPLPNLVMFPRVSQLLHIFEPRYRQMMQAALDGDRLIAMAVLAPGWERDYEGSPPLYSTVCLGRITTFRRLEDGRYYLLLEGVSRARIVRELPPTQLFREARAELLEDVYDEASVDERTRLHERLLAAVRRQLPQLAELGEQLSQLFCGPLSLGMLTDVTAYTLDLDVQLKVHLLEEPNVARRAAMLLDAMTPEGVPVRTKYPPDFSDN